MREKSPFSVGNLTVGTAPKLRLGVLAAAVRGILAARAPALVRSAGPGAIPGEISEGSSIGVHRWRRTRCDALFTRCFSLLMSGALTAPHRLH